MHYTVHSVHGDRVVYVTRKHVMKITDAFDVYIARRHNRYDYLDAIIYLNTNKV